MLPCKLHCLLCCLLLFVLAVGVNGKLGPKVKAELEARRMHRGGYPFPAHYPRGNAPAHNHNQKGHSHSHPHKGKKGKKKIRRKGKGCNGEANLRSDIAIVSYILQGFSSTAGITALTKFHGWHGSRSETIASAIDETLGLVSLALNTLVTFPEKFHKLKWAVGKTLGWGVVEKFIWGYGCYGWRGGGGWGGEGGWHRSDVDEDAEDDDNDEMAKPSRRRSNFGH